jgi:phosphate transport system permease protein
MSLVRITASDLTKAPSGRDARRRRSDQLMRGVMFVTAAAAVVPLIGLITFIAIHGIPFLSSQLILNSPLDKEPGISNAIIGSLQLTIASIIVAAPVGIAGGVYLNEFASPRISSAGELLIDVMLGTPSILAGLFAFLVVVPALGFSGWAAIVALSVLMIPVVMRTTQEVIRLVPAGVREASLALGIPVWKTTIFVTCRTAASGLLTGMVLAISRGLGETAPLLLTAKGTNDTEILNFGSTMNAMPIVIYRYAYAADKLHIGQAWATALVLLVIALVLNVAVRFRTINSRVA